MCHRSAPIGNPNNATLFDIMPTLGVEDQAWHPDDIAGLAKLCPECKGCGRHHTQVTIAGIVRPNVSLCPNCTGTGLVHTNGKSIHFGVLHNASSRRASRLASSRAPGVVGFSDRFDIRRRNSRDDVAVGIEQP